MKKEAPWIVWNSKMPRPVEGSHWVPIKANPIKPQQVQGWRRIELSKIITEIKPTGSTQAAHIAEALEEKEN